MQLPVLNSTTRFITLAILLVSYGVTCQQTCYKYVLIAARGTNEPPGPVFAFKGMINTTLNTIPGGIEYDLQYPASYNLIPSAIQGGEAIRKYINAGIAACPNQQYAILGYSQGASATALGLQHFTDQNSAAYKAIKGILVIGNPGHIYGSDANIDQFGGRSTRNYVGAFWFGGLGALPKVYYQAGKILDICYQADIICALGSPNSTFISPDPNYIPPHGQYGFDENVQRLAANFLIEKLK